MVIYHEEPLKQRNFKKEKEDDDDDDDGRLF
jgi:hypothetical protein